MKKINSIGYAHKIIGLAVVFLMVIPFGFLILQSIFSLYLFTLFMFLSMGLGLLILLIFIGMLVIEFHQDKKAKQQYDIVRKTKLPLGNGLHECQSCGNRQVNGMAEKCGVCGMQFTDKGK